jgi:hypothetical protein
VGDHRREKIVLLKTSILAIVSMHSSTFYRPKWTKKRVVKHREIYIPHPVSPLENHDYRGCTGIGHRARLDVPEV